MKKYLLTMVALTMTAGAAWAGFVQPVPVQIDIPDPMVVAGSALGNQWTARSSDNDVELIGCGVRVFDDGVNSFSFGFCQATDSDGQDVACFTDNPNLIETMRAISDFAFITFTWQDDGNGGAECTRVGFSTQSFYLPDFAEKDSDDDSDSDSDSDSD